MTDAYDRNDGRPVPPDGFYADATTQGDEACPKATEPTTTVMQPTQERKDGGHGEPEPTSDVLGAMSLFFGVMALFVTPFVPTCLLAGPIAFAVTSIACGAIRLSDDRFKARGDAAVAGLVASIVALMVAFLMGMADLATYDPERGSIPFGGCSSPDQVGTGLVRDWEDSGRGDDRELGRPSRRHRRGRESDGWEDVDDLTGDERYDEWNDGEQFDGDGDYLDWEPRIEEVPVYFGEEQPELVPLADPDDGGLVHRAVTG